MPQHGWTLPRVCSTTPFWTVVAYSCLERSSGSHAAGCAPPRYRWLVRRCGCLVAGCTRRCVTRVYCRSRILRTTVDSLRVLTLALLVQIYVTRCTPFICSCVRHLRRWLLQFMKVCSVVGYVDVYGYVVATGRRLAIWLIYVTLIVTLLLRLVTLLVIWLHYVQPSPAMPIVPVGYVVVDLLDTIAAVGVDLVVNLFLRC